LVITGILYCNMVPAERDGKERLFRCDLLMLEFVPAADGVVAYC